MCNFSVGGGAFVVVALAPPLVCCTTHQEMPPATTSTLARASGFWREPGIDGNLTGPASSPLPTMAANTPTTPSSTGSPATLPASTPRLYAAPPTGWLAVSE